MSFKRSKLCNLSLKDLQVVAGELRFCNVVYQLSLDEICRGTDHFEWLVIIGKLGLSKNVERLLWSATHEEH